MVAINFKLTGFCTHQLTNQSIKTETGCDVKASCNCVDYKRVNYKRYTFTKNL